LGVFRWFVERTIVAQLAYEGQGGSELAYQLVRFREQA
jgi:hypothetical protein